MEEIMTFKYLQEIMKELKIVVDLLENKKCEVRTEEQTEIAFKIIENIQHRINLKSIYIAGDPHPDSTKRELLNEFLMAYSNTIKNKFEMILHQIQIEHDIYCKRYKKLNFK